jgi:hypothetical protein
VQLSHNCNANDVVQRNQQLLLQQQQLLSCLARTWWRSSRRCCLRGWPGARSGSQWDPAAAAAAVAVAAGRVSSTQHNGYCADTLPAPLIAAAWSSEQQSTSPPAAFPQYPDYSVLLSYIPHDRSLPHDHANNPALHAPSPMPPSPQLLLRERPTLPVTMACTKHPSILCVPRLC